MVACLWALCIEKGVATGLATVLSVLGLVFQHYVNTSHGHWYAGMQAKTLLACTEIAMVSHGISNRPTL